tara:strand:- start:8005 stop:8778 length:774 start_codon:yes stop_codon:yes gene_type:complete
MSLKYILSKIFWHPYSDKEKIERFQKIIRDNEWSELAKYIPKKSNFLDVGCGSGDNMFKAKKELHCTVQGVDPNPGNHGVGRYSSEKYLKNIKKGVSENLPYPDKNFDVVFCSHVLEHVANENKCLKEMKRVAKDNGILIIGMPTALMSWIGLFSSYLFTTHTKLLNTIKSVGKQTFFINLRTIFLPNSHSYPRAKTILYDLYYYRTSNWRRIVSKEFCIEKTLKPFLYPYPDFIQIFKIRKSNLGSSSVFFICKKK